MILWSSSSRFFCVFWAWYPLRGATFTIYKELKNTSFMSANSYSKALLYEFNSYNKALLYELNSYVRPYVWVELIRKAFNSYVTKFTQCQIIVWKVNNIQLLNEEEWHNTFYELRACPKLIKNNSYRGLARVDYYIVCTEGLGPSYIQLIMLHFWVLWRYYSLIIVIINNPA